MMNMYITMCVEGWTTARKKGKQEEERTEDEFLGGREHV
jgi:hypothetical protein